LQQLEPVKVVVETLPLQQQPDMGKPATARSRASQIKKTIEYLSSVL
jgi:hypothetical protein